MSVSNLVARKGAIIFDLFFTLVSPDIEDLDFPPTYEVLGVEKSAWRQQTFGSSNARLTGAETDPYEIVGSMARAIDPTISSSVIREATDQRIARFERILMNAPRTTLATLGALRELGLKVALVTNADAIETQAWSRSPLAALFDVTVMSWQVGAAKPDARIYNHCLEHLQLSSSHCVFVGDGGSDE